MVDILNSKYSPLLAQALSQQAQVKTYGDVRDRTQSPLAAGLASYLAAKQGITANNTLAELLGKNADIERADKERAFRIQEQAANLSALTGGLQLQELLRKSQGQQAFKDVITGQQAPVAVPPAAPSQIGGLDANGNLMADALAGVPEDPTNTESIVIDDTGAAQNVTPQQSMPVVNQTPLVTDPRAVALARVDPEAALKMQMDIDKNKVERQQKLEDDKNKPTENQAKAANYGTRMYEATNLLGKFEDLGKPTYATSVASNIPLVGGYLQKEASTPEQQQYYQAAQDWVRAKLRKESGAAIGKDEMAQEIATYFPQVGDKPEVIAQKAQARDIANRAIAQEAGPAWKQPKIKSEQVNSALEGKTATNPTTGEKLIYKGGKWSKI